LPWSEEVRLRLGWFTVEATHNQKEKAAKTKDKKVRPNEFSVSKPAQPGCATIAGSHRHLEVPK
jgi:hypothetical protein